MSWLPETEVHRNDYESITFVIGRGKNNLLWIAIYSWYMADDEDFEEGSSYIELRTEGGKYWKPIWSQVGMPTRSPDGEKHDLIWDYLLGQKPGVITEAEIVAYYERMQMEALL